MTPRSQKINANYANIINTIIGVMVGIIAYFGADALSDLKQTKKDVQDIRTQNIVKSLTDSFNFDKLNERVDALEKAKKTKTKTGGTYRTTAYSER